MKRLPDAVSPEASCANAAGAKAAVAAMARVSVRMDNMGESPLVFYAPGRGARTSWRCTHEPRLCASGTFRELSRAITPADPARPGDHACACRDRKSGVGG